MRKQDGFGWAVVFFLGLALNTWAVALNAASGDAGWAVLSALGAAACAAGLTAELS